jgi:hypothetical protein
VEISDELKEIKNSLEQTEPWVYLCEIDLPVFGMKRICNHVTAITFNGHTWDAWPFMPSGIKYTSSGEMSTATVSIGNATGFFTSYLMNNEVTGRAGNIYKLSKAKLDDPVYSVIPNLFKILTWMIVGPYVQFTLSLGVDVFNIEAPIIDYTMENSPHLPYGPARISLGTL